MLKDYKTRQIKSDMTHIHKIGHEIRFLHDEVHLKKDFDFIRH